MIPRSPHRALVYLIANVYLYFYLLWRHYYVYNKYNVYWYYQHYFIYQYYVYYQYYVNYIKSVRHPLRWSHIVVALPSVIPSSFYVSMSVSLGESLPVYSSLSALRFKWCVKCTSVIRSCFGVPMSISSGSTYPRLCGLSSRPVFMSWSPCLGRVDTRAVRLSA